MIPHDADYSCGCMDYGFRRPKEAWEASDGAAHLLKELSERAPEAVPEFLPELADIAALEDFEACRSLQTTIWKQLPCIAKGLGKRVGHLAPGQHHSMWQRLWGIMDVSDSCLSVTPGSMWDWCTAIVLRWSIRLDSSLSEVRAPGHSEPDATSCRLSRGTWTCSGTPSFGPSSAGTPCVKQLLRSAWQR